MKHLPCLPLTEETSSMVEPLFDKQTLLVFNLFCFLDFSVKKKRKKNKTSSPSPSIATTIITTDQKSTTQTSSTTLIRSNYSTSTVTNTTMIVTSTPGQNISTNVTGLMDGPVISKKQAVTPGLFMSIIIWIVYIKG